VPVSALATALEDTTASSGGTEVPSGPPAHPVNRLGTTALSYPVHVKSTPFTKKVFTENGAVLNVESAPAGVLILMVLLAPAPEGLEFPLVVVLTVIPVGRTATTFVPERMVPATVHPVNALAVLLWQAMSTPPIFRLPTPQSAGPSAQGIRKAEGRAPGSGILMVVAVLSSPATKERGPGESAMGGLFASTALIPAGCAPPRQSPLSRMGASAVMVGKSVKSLIRSESRMRRLACEKNRCWNTDGLVVSSSESSRGRRIKSIGAAPSDTIGRERFVAPVRPVRM
jgi:hypothetical protein